jgi:hypothetical protein
VEEPMLESIGTGKKTKSPLRTRNLRASCLISHEFLHVQEVVVEEKE